MMVEEAIKSGLVFQLLRKTITLAFSNAQDRHPSADAIAMQLEAKPCTDVHS